MPRSTLLLIGALIVAVAFFAIVPPAQHIDPEVEESVHPELRPFLAQIRLIRRSDSVNAQYIPKARGAKVPEPLPEPKVVAARIPAARGRPSVAVYLINSDPRHKRPVIIDFHGGGFMWGSAAASLPQLQELSRELDCVIVAVDYRLAPEHPFPGPVDDAYAALEWVHGQASKIGVDRARIAIMGRSAGGGLAAMLAIRARDAAKIPLVLQALIYPMLDDRTGSTRPAAPRQGTLVWGPGDNRFGWTSFLGRPPGGDQAPYGAVPARAADLRGVAPAFIGVGTIDLFHDEDAAYATRLRQSGVPVEFVAVPGAYHAFDEARGTKVADDFHAALVAALKQGFAAPRP